MSIVSGVIQRKSVKGMTTKDGKPWGNRYSFMIGTDWYSVIDSKITDNHVRGLVEGLKEGEEVEFNFEDVPSSRPGESFHNITGACRVERVDRGESTVEKVPPVQPPGRGDFPYSMKISYMKDLQIGFPEADEKELLRRVYLLKTMADRLGE